MEIDEIKKAKPMPALDRPDFNWEDFSLEQRIYIDKLESELLLMEQDRDRWKNDYEWGRHFRKL